jgi:hypothetical protein
MACPIYIYWGGLVQDAREARKYNRKLPYPLQSPAGNLAHMRDLAQRSMIFGAIDPGRIISKFYGDVLLSYISCITGRGWG